jgi:hypothetical protein
MSDQNAIFEELLQAWFHTLPPEERAAALTVKDGAFVSTLIHFASLSTSSQDEGKAEIDGRGECLVGARRKRFRDYAQIAHFDRDPVGRCAST